MRNLNIYIIHCSLLIEREDNIKNIESIFNKLQQNNNPSLWNVNIKIINDYQFNTFDKEKIKNLVKLEPIEEEDFKKYNNFLRNLTPQSISKTLKHFKCFQEIKNSKNNEDINLIIEDDVTIEDVKFIDNLQLIISKLDPNFDICMLGLPSSTNFIENNTYSIIDSKNIYNTIPGSDSYFISIKGANKLLNNFIPIRFELNIQLSYAAEKNNVIINQVSPNITVEGSKIGIFKSRTNINNFPIYNFKYKEFNNLILKPNLDEEEKKKLILLSQDDVLKNNPDFQYLIGLYHFKNEEYTKTLEIFNNVYEIYKLLNLQLSKESNFIQNMVEIYKFVQ
jgi:GR25 family glycosyltransferase involved in LPS biosynthesis